MNVITRDKIKIKYENDIKKKEKKRNVTNLLQKNVNNYKKNFFLCYICYVVPPYRPTPLIVILRYLSFPHHSISGRERESTSCLYD